jgi:hypothetical protein
MRDKIFTHGVFSFLFFQVKATIDRGHRGLISTESKVKVDRCSHKGLEMTVVGSVLDALETTEEDEEEEVYKGS